MAVLFDLKTGQMAYEIIGRVAGKNFSVFANHILHLKVVSRDRRQYDVGSEVKKLLGWMLSGRKAVSDVMEMELIPSPDTLYNELQSLMLSSDVSDQIVGAQMAAIIAQSKPELHESQVETTFIPPLFALTKFKFAVLMTSDRRSDWKANAVSAIKTSLDGQLREQAAPVIFMRFNDLNAREVANFFHSESAGKILSPPDAILWEVARSPGSYRKRLCALMLTNQPSYTKSAILNPQGKALYKRNPDDKFLYLPDNPVGFQLQGVIDHR